MSVDISRLAAHLAPQQQETIRKEYRKRAWHDTTAFLLCFFGGIFGAHRFYLRQYGQGLLHLVFPVAALVVLVAGIATNLHPVIIALVIILLLLIGLVWSIVDLFRIDDQVYAHNLKLAEQLIARVMLSDHSVEQAAAARLGELRHEAEAASAAAGVAAGHTAETEIEYHATTVTQVSAAAPEQEKEHASTEPQNWTHTEQVPVGGYGPPVQETVTHSHVESPQSVTDSVETVRTFEPQLPAGASPEDTQPAPYVDLDPTTAPAHDFPAPGIVSPEPSASEAPTWPDHPPVEFAAPLAAAGAAGLAAGALAAEHEYEQAPAEAETMGRMPDFTDLGAGDAAPAGPVADIAVPYSAPQHVTLPPEPAPVPVPTFDPYAAPTHATNPSGSGDGLVVLAPDDVAAETRAADPVPEAPSVWDVPTERYAPPAAAETAAAEPPIWPAPEPETQPWQPAEPAPAQPAPEPAAPVAYEEPPTQAYEPPTQPYEPPTQPYGAVAAGAVGAGLLGGAAALAAEHHASAEPEAAAVPPAEAPPVEAAPAPPEAPPVPHERRKLRRVRVTRQIVIDGKVMDETSAEELIPADADPEPVRARLHDQLQAQAEARERELRGQS